MQRSVNSVEQNTESSGKNQTLFLCGDVMTGRGIDQILPRSVDPRIYEPFVRDAREYVHLAERETGTIPQPVSHSYVWGAALQVWNETAPDFKIINLETSVTAHGEPWPEKGINYRMHPENADLLTAAGINCCTLANNHVLDWGREGLADTLRTLRRVGISAAGAGNDREAADTPALLENDKGRVIVYSCGATTSGIPESWAAGEERAGVKLLSGWSSEVIEEIRRRVEAVKRPGDVVVFSVHWGGNWGYRIPKHQQHLARSLIDRAGVDLVVGHSSHHPKGIEVYKGKLILYGTGDFINDYEGIGGHERFHPELTLMYFPSIDPATGELASMRMVPMRIRHFRLNSASAAEAKWLENLLTRLGETLGTSARLNRDGSLSLQWQ
jgi:poly-gamma-glutamate synthesis protein (capsule biosynthesis protein)